MQYKRKHRLSAALMAGAMCCTMIPAASADEIATPETAEAAAAEATNQVEQPAASDGGLSVEEIQSRMYPSLPQTATGYYLDSNGLPVLTGETKISIEGWGDEDYRDYDADSTIQVALDEGLLNTDSATASFPRMDGEDYAIVPISMQVLYPANGGSADITLSEIKFCSLHPAPCRSVVRKIRIIAGFLKLFIIRPVSYLTVRFTRKVV